MYSFYRLVYNGTWELQKPKKPDFIIFPPASDIENLFQPPDLSGIDLLESGRRHLRSDHRVVRMGGEGDRGGHPIGRRPHQDG